MIDAPQPLTDASPTDRECLHALESGERWGVERLLERYQSRIANTVYQIVGDWDAALDVTQDTFVRMLRRAKTYRGAGSVRGWVFAIAVNLAKDYLRRRRRIVYLDRVSDEAGSQPQATVHDPLERAETRERVHRVLADLPDGVRALLVLRDFEELTHEELCALYDCELGTVKSRLHRARKQFAECFRRQTKATR